MGFWDWLCDALGFDSGSQQVTISSGDMTIKVGQSSSIGYKFWF